MRKNSKSAGSFESLVGMKWASHAWKIFSELSWTGIWGSIGWEGRGREWWLFPGCPKCWVKKKKKRKENQAFGQLRKKKSLSMSHFHCYWAAGSIWPNCLSITMSVHCQSDSHWNAQIKVNKNCFVKCCVWAWVSGK